jgi:hypothetical protein
MYSAAIVAGTTNLISTYSSYSTIINGNNNIICRGVYANIIGSKDSCIYSPTTMGSIINSCCSVIAPTQLGGSQNVGILDGCCNQICASYFSTLIGGADNKLQNGYQNTIIGGCSNCISGASAGGGVYQSTITASTLSYILYGHNNGIFASRCSSITGVFGSTNSIAIIGGECINVSASTKKCIVYSNNFCAYGGKFYGDGSALTGLATGSFITTGQTGVFGAAGYVSTGSTGVFVTTGQTGDFITTGMTGAFGGANVNLSGYLRTGQLEFLSEAPFTMCSFVVGSDFSNSGSRNSVFNSLESCAEYTSRDNFISSTNYSIVSGGVANSAILGGIYNVINASVTGSIILGGSGIVASINNTVYANNLCVVGGVIYGNGSGITGINSQVNKCQILAKNNTPFDICAVTRVASTYIGNQRITDNSYTGMFYFCDHNDSSVDDCNLYSINNYGYCAAQFSAMILGNAIYGGEVFTTSIKIEGVATSSGVVNQNKTIHSQSFPTDDACVIVENQSLKIYITGAATGMNWGVRLDVLGMQGYD